MWRWRHGGWPAAALILVAVAGMAAVLIADWPGHFPPDAISELAQGRSGVFNLWHPPVTAWLLGMADRLSPDAAGFIVLDAALFFASLAGFAFTSRPGWPAVVTLALIAASPLALIYQGLVVKDVLFANATVAAFAALAWAAKLWDRPPVRLVLIVLALAFLVLAGLVRQNGALVAAVGCATLAAIAASKARRRRRVPSFAIAGAASALLVTAGVMAADLAFIARSDREPEEARQWMSLQVYDLAGEVRREPALPLNVLDRKAPALASFVRRQAAPAYDVTRADPILGLKAWKQSVATPTPWIGRQWRATALASPGLYLRARSAAFWQVLATPRVDACAPVLVGVDPGDPGMLAAAGLAARDTDRDDWDGDYAAAFLGTPVFSHLAWGGLALVLLLLAARDVARGRRPEMVATIGLIAAAVIFSASFFAISLACDYRYLYLLDVAAMAALVQRLSARGGS
ncbi:MAG TPA: hypothetical protein VGF71_09255 [Caulobacteraceae bacterium]|jgi:hypothetical protein